MAESLDDKIFFDNAEGRLKGLIGARIEVEIYNLGPLFKNCEGVVQKDETTSSIELILEGVFRNKATFGIGLVGKSSEYYWAIGTHTEEGNISIILDDKREIVYNMPEPYVRIGKSWGLNAKKIKEHREEMKWTEVNDPKNPFLDISNLIIYESSTQVLIPVIETKFPHRGISGLVDYIAYVFDTPLRLVYKILDSK